MPRFKVYHDCPDGPRPEFHEAKSYADAKNRYGRGLFVVCVLDVDERDPDADVLQVADDLDLFVELHPEDHTLAIRSNSLMVTFPLTIAGALVNDLLGAKSWCSRLAQLRESAQRRSEGTSATKHNRSGVTERQSELALGDTTTTTVAGTKQQS